MYVSVLCDSEQEREMVVLAIIQTGTGVDSLGFMCIFKHVCVCVSGCVYVVTSICLCACKCVCLYKKCVQAAACGEFVFWRCVPDRVCYKQAFLCVRLGGARLKNCEGV